MKPYLRVWITLLAVALVGSAQVVQSYFKDLVSTPDGSALYFTSLLPPSGSGMKQGSRIYRVVGESIQLVVDVPSTEVPYADTLNREPVGVHGPMLNPLGHLQGWSVFSVCRASIAQPCFYQVAAQTVVRLDGRVYANTAGQQSYQAVNSPESKFLLRPVGGGLGAVRLVAQETADPAVEWNCGYGYVSSAEISDAGDCIYNDRMQEHLVFARRVEGDSFSIPMKEGVAVAVTPGTRRAFALSDQRSRFATRLIQIDLDRIDLSSGAPLGEIVADVPQLSCTEMRTARGGVAVLRCLGQKPFWLWNGQALVQLSLEEPSVLAWTLALDGDHIWLVDGEHRIRRFQLSSGAVETRTRGLVSAQGVYSGGPMPGGGWLQVQGTGFVATQLPEVWLGRQKIEVQYRSATQILGWIPAGSPESGGPELRLQLTGEGNEFEAPLRIAPNTPGALTSSRWFAFGNPSYGWVNYAPALVFSSNFESVIVPEQPARPGEVIHFYTSGPRDGDVICRLDGLELHVLYSGPAPGLPGIEQNSVFLPDEVETGLHAFGCRPARSTFSFVTLLPVARGKP